MKRIIRSALAVLLAATGLTLVGGAVASAKACTGSPGNYFDGWQQLYANTPTQSNWGISADLTYEAPVVCSGDVSAYNTPSAWVMVDDGHGHGEGTGGWAQTGQVSGPFQGCMEHFAQEVVVPGDVPQEVDYGYPGGHCAANGQVHKVWVTYNSAAHQFDYNIDSTTIMLGSTRVSTTWQFSAAGYEMYGEVGYLESNTPGTQAIRSDYNNITYQAGPGAAWTSMCGIYLVAGSDNPSHWTYTAPACNHIQMYTSVPQ